MPKDSYFFSHDYGARNDPKMQKLLMRLGQAGKGVYWDLIEISFEQGGYLKLSDIENYAFALRTDFECITRLINEFDLFKKNDNIFWSDSVLKRLDRRNQISKKASESAQTRWANANASNNNANALPTHEKTMLREEKKGEEKKGKKKRVNKVFTAPSFDEFLTFFLDKGLSKDYANHVFQYYVEGNWHDSKGNPVLSWKQKIISVWMKPGDEEKFFNKIKNQQNGNETIGSITAIANAGASARNKAIANLNPDGSFR